jgi:predicted PhzF superfamily epimerase YddE/YHI9
VRVPYYRVSAFTATPFGGNPAGVCLLPVALPDHLLQSIAAENNLSETAFLVPEGSDYGLRWFTPSVEVDLCGHATLASAHVLFHELGSAVQTLRFHTRSGCLTASRNGPSIELDFPSRPPQACDAPPHLVAGLNARPAEVLRSRDYVAVFRSEEEVQALRPEMSLIATLDCLGVIATAPGRTCDFVSRFFAPQAGVPEDPVTGSAHCSLIPLWANRLGKTTLCARQVSARGGELSCRLNGDRVSIGGQCATFQRGELQLS